MKKKKVKTNFKINFKTLHQQREWAFLRNIKMCLCSLKIWGYD